VSEAEIKALSVNYAALLKEKEVWVVITFLHIYTCNMLIFLPLLLMSELLNVQLFQMQLLAGNSQAFDA